MSARGWWYRASREQKLAQIDGGIECGLTAREIAICSGLLQERRLKVNNFATAHGRKLPTPQWKRADATVRRKGNARRAYWQGDRDLTDYAIAHRNDVHIELTFE